MQGTDMNMHMQLLEARMRVAKRCYTEEEDLLQGPEKIVIDRTSPESGCMRGRQLCKHFPISLGDLRLYSESGQPLNT